MKANKTFCFFILLLVLCFLASPVYMSNSPPPLRTDVAKVEGRLIHEQSDSVIVHNTEPQTLWQVADYKPRSKRNWVIYHYEFEVNQQKINAQFNSSLCFLSSCRQMKEMNLQGPQISVYYDPKNPEKNWLFPPPQYSDLEKFLVGFIFLCLISAALTAYFFRSVKSTRNLP